MAECKMDWSPVRMDTYRWTCRVCGESVERDSSAGHPYRACPAQTHPMTTDRDAALRELRAIVMSMRQTARFGDKRFGVHRSVVEQWADALEDLRDPLTPSTDGVMVPKVPSIEVLRFLRSSVRGKYPEDWERGKRMQRAHGTDVIPPECNTEIAAGWYERLIELAAAPKQKEQP